MQVQTACRHIEGDQITVGHQCQRTTGCRLRHGVQHHRAISRAAHARIADPDHVGDALAQDLRRQGHVANLGHAGIALGAAVLEDQHAGLVDIERLIVDAAVKIIAVFEDNCPPGVLHESRSRCAWLDDRAAGREIAAQHSDTGSLLERRLQAHDHIRVEILSTSNVLADCHAIGCHRIEMQMGSDRLHDRRQTTGVAEVLHQILAGRLQIDQTRQLASQPIEIINRQGHANSPGNCDQVDHGIGAAADSRKRADRVFEGLAGEDARELLVLVDHFNDAPPCPSGQHIATTIDCRISRVARQANPQRLDHRGHGARGAHGHTVAMAAMHAALGFEKILQF